MTTDSPLTDDSIFTPERLADVHSGDRDRVRRGIAGVPRPVMEEWLRTEEGAGVLQQAVDMMPAFYVGDGPDVPDVERIVRWRIQRPPAEPVECDVLIGPAGCSVRPATGAPADVTFVLDGVSFAELASAARNAMELMVQGRLHVQGDVQLAMRMESLFGFTQADTA